MTFTSTRRAAPPVTLRTALLDGLAPDGGLYVPERVPPLPRGWRDAPTFADLAVGVLAPWLAGEVPHWERAVRDALNFPVPLVALRGGDWDGVRVLELFHGPTLSFKDFGARLMARLMDGVRPDKTPLTILVATSGDTGSAVADGFAGLPGIRVVLLFPAGQVSAVQERQLVAPRPGVTALRVEGTFDQCQQMVKGAFHDPALAGVALSSANSINVGRLLPQMLFYVEAIRQGGFEEAVFVTPSGNLGNLTGGVLAQMAGLPVRQFVAAHNANRFFPDRLAGREVEMGASVRTLSNAMDVGAPSNYERLTRLLGGEMARHIRGETVGDGDTLAAMRDVYRQAGYVACPHTAVGLEAARRYRARAGDGTPLVVLATAHPAKFPDVAQKALGAAPDEPETLARLRRAPGRATTIPPTPDALRAAILA